ncbi:MAG: DNA translocase FtsK [Sphaerochaeta sp.]|nr:DNA translocase FtsK [Sphaerochaeta sp.]
MKGRKGRISLLAGAGCLVASLVVAALVALPLFGITNPLLERMHASLSRIFSFTVDPSRFGLAPLALLLFVWSIMIFSFRSKKRFSYILIPLTAIMTYTLYTLSHLLQESSRPFFSDFLLSSSADPRSASFKVVLLFIAETAMFVLFTLLGDALDRYRAAKLERQERSRRMMEQKIEQQKQKEEKKASRHFPSAKRSKREQPVDEQDQVTLIKKPVAEQKEEEGVELGRQQVNFPPIAEVPPLGSLSKRRHSISKPSERDVIQVDEIQVHGKVSIGALHTLTEERKRNNGLSYLERKQLELAQAKSEQAEQPKEPVQLSGFLQGALEAVGKAPHKRHEKIEQPKGRAKGMLAEAVEQQQTRQDEPAPATPKQNDEALSIKERVLSVRYEENPSHPLLASEMQREVEAAKPAVSAPIEKLFAGQSTARPINGGFSDDVPKVEQDSEDETDLLEPSSGVGGLSGSALINTNRITYQFPSESMLVTYPKVSDVIDETTLKRGEVLVSTLQEFNVTVELVNIVRGPTVTMFELLPAAGVRVNSIVNLSDNIALALAATQVRIVAPIPGKSAVGVEIPNLRRDIIGFREMLGSLPTSFGIPMVLGRNLMGEPVVIDVIKAPHLLIAGSTGSGKSVCVNSLICSVLFRCSPKQVRMILVDPKIVELNVYNGIPHLLTPVITEAKRTLKALDFCLYEMDRRYKLLQGLSVRNIIGYNEKIEASHLAREKLPYILVVIDEFADLMHLVGKDMESKVSRLAAMSRAVGIHLVLATQRPSVDVITGVIKNNIPTRIAFAVTSATDSRIILDEQGADKLLGKGDMLYMSSSNPATERIQGSFLSDHEVEKVVKFVSSQGVPDFIDESFFEDEEQKASDSESEDGVDVNDDDELMQRALTIVVERKCASASYLQRRLKIGYNRAARLVEQMEEMGYVGPPNGSKPRELIKYP